jgi:hypothetical protein
VPDLYSQRSSNRNRCVRGYFAFTTCCPFFGVRLTLLEAPALLVWAKDYCYRVTSHFRPRRPVPLVSSSLLLGYPMFVAAKWHQKAHRSFATGQDEFVVVVPIQSLGDTSAECQDKHYLVRSQNHPCDMLSVCEGGISLLASPSYCRSPKSDNSFHKSWYAGSNFIYMAVRSRYDTVSIRYDNSFDGSPSTIDYDG